MERLTQKSPVTDMVWFIDHENKDTFLEPCEMNSHHNRLAIQKLNEYERAEEQGLLLRLPCKVGDTVYVKLASYCDLPHAEAEVRDFTHFTTCGFCVVVTSKHFDKLAISFAEFGKTVFLTKEEAYKALEENTSFVVTDPKGTLLRETGHFIEKKGYRIEVLDLDKNK